MTIAARSAASSEGIPPLPPALPGQMRDLAGRAGRVRLYSRNTNATTQPPVLLVHSINAAASAYEVRPIFTRMPDDRPTYALDLPGYGLSDRSQRHYDIRLFTDAVLDALDAIRTTHGDTPVDGLGLSLSSEFVARAASERPDAFRSLTLVTPTGFRSRDTAAQRDDPSGPGIPNREIGALYGIFNFPLWSDGLFSLLTSRKSIRYFLQRTFGSPNVDEGLVDYDVLSTRQPGARNAPLAFLCGRLFSRDIGQIYRRLTLPVWVPHGTRGDFRDFSGAGWARGRDNWSFQPYPTGALPHFEQPDAFMADYLGFLDRLSPPVPAPAVSVPASASGRG